MADDDDLIDMAVSELDQAVEELTVSAHTFTPADRIQLAQVYALTSIAQSLALLAGGQQLLPEQQYDDFRPAY